MASGKMVGGWFSGDKLKRLEKRAADAFKGNQSAYIASLVEKDLEGPAGAADAEIILALVRRFQPTLLPTLEHLFRTRKVDQPRAVARFLEALEAALIREPKFNPAQPFELYTDVQRASMLDQFNHTIRELMDRTSPRDPLLNDPPAAGDGQSPRGAHGAASKPPKKA